ncbi:DUF4893 domain-containing protein [Roseomonas sp. CAU 1739]|uniref:DUF4893 domain-containing protein n=1 Tax=Roseomonas sp. CAU 1739 TaxID=3140364 RepID=UPI00325AEAF7
MPHRLLCLAVLAAFPLCVAAGHALAQAPPARASSPAIAVAPGADWRSQASERDRQRLDALAATWAEALESVRAGGQAPAVTAAGALLDSRPGEDGAPPPAGAYRCRSLRIGAVDPEAVAFIAYPAFRCRIAVTDGVTVFEKLNGSQRTAGVIIPDSPLRSVLIGTEAQGSETGFPRYGADAARDRIAAVERVGPDRWRMVFPRPANGAVIEVMELTRATAAPEPPSSPARGRSGTSRRG